MDVAEFWLWVFDFTLAMAVGVRLGQIIWRTKCR